MFGRLHLRSSAGHRQHANAVDSPDAAGANAAAAGNVSSEQGATPWIAPDELARVDMVGGQQPYRVLETLALHAVHSHQGPQAQQTAGPWFRSGWSNVTSITIMMFMTSTPWPLLNSIPLVLP
jgi:hypothetical protein